MMMVMMRDSMRDLRTGTDSDPPPPPPAGAEIRVAGPAAARRAGRRGVDSVLGLFKLTSDSDWLLGQLEILNLNIEILSQVLSSGHSDKQIHVNFIG